MCAALERTVSKVESEYMAATKAAKVAVGYKELMQATTSSMIDELAFGKNHKVRLEDETDNVDCDLDVLLLKTNAFLSGIPFFFKNPANIAAKNVMKNMIKLNTNTFYIPFNTITLNCKFVPSIDPSVKISIQCSVINKVAPNTLKINFLEFDVNDPEKMMIVNYINQDLDKRQLARRSFIQQKFSEVQAGVFAANTVSKQIAQIQQSDAQIKKAKEESIEKLKKQIAELTTSKIALQKMKQTLSMEVQTVQTKSTVVYNLMQKKIAYRISLEATIKTLEGQISSADALKKLNENINTSLTTLKYWLQGSVYHRVISETEMTGLIGMALNDASFDGKVNDYFFPQ
jgi:CRISPR/Cas system-associated endoribonuclease Cas2